MSRLPRPSVPFDRRKSELSKMNRLDLVAEMTRVADEANILKNVPNMTNEQIIAYILRKEGR